MADVDDAATAAREEGEAATPEVPNDPGAGGGDDLNKAGSEPAGRGD
ncbi:MAG: hypothetical protein QOI56_2117 [Actinomycetota bacterium]|jgi:hypothetical protein|nr:hypothetical protein [Actinomycetota bacterium]